MIDRYRQRDARKSEKEASRQTKEKEEKHEGVDGSDCYCRSYSGGGVWLQD
ncbi:hypothetical protein IMM1_02980 [Pseudocoprococcus immobilis]